MAGPALGRVAEVAVWLWSGELAVLSGRSGRQIWRKKIGEGFTDGLATLCDLNDDGLDDLLVGGNDGTVRACSGRDGSILWSGRLARPIRDIASTNRPPRSPVVYACTAGDLMTLPRYMLCTHKTREQFRAWLTGEDAPADKGKRP